MAEIITDPVTGRQRSVEVRYDEGMDSVNPQAVARLFETQKLEDAEKAMSAAIQFQGVRGYQQALKAGEPAEKALTRYGPMMFYQRPSAFGPAVRAVTPPQMTPFQQATIEERKKRAGNPMIRPIPGGGFVSINPANQSVTTIRQPTESPGATISPAAASRMSVDALMTGDPMNLSPQLQEITRAGVSNALRRIQPPAGPTTNSPTKKRLRWNPKTGDFE